MTARAARLPALLAALLLGACADPEAEIPAVVVEATTTELVVRAQGELIASESLPITLPGTIRMGFNIAWMAPEFSEVKQGDVIARFDDVQIRLDREATALNVSSSRSRFGRRATASSLLA